MKFKICHVTTYRYDEPVTDSVNEIRLAPRTNYRQSCYHHSVAIEPNAPLLTYEDGFGNRIHAFTVNASHRELVIRSESTVVTHDNDGLRKRVLTPEEDWAALASDAVQNKYAEYLIPTPYTEANDAVAAFAASCRRPGAGVYEQTMELVSSIYKEFEYRPNATRIGTTPAELLEGRAGVCQDFAHLMIAACRLSGIPARYASGYHFIGDLQSRAADFEQASHAWVEAYIPGTGWLGFDPTNNHRVDGRYIKLGHGRDYLDIVPVKGIYRGTPNQRLFVDVDVQLIDK
ncbi:transglutaminase family protein [Paenibacillus sp.]|uniref:transglutaminase family protein n=1 Tax=Paenibacillus sp. TaxID=58172 RepID=UPI002811F58E|nr:transglutaminase family protein [Paenibacillus sp.]